MIHKYFSIWSYLVLLNVYMGYINPWHGVFNSSIASVGGAYIAWYYPKILRIPYTNIYIHGWSLLFSDIISHHIPFIGSMFLLMHRYVSLTFSKYICLHLLPLCYLLTSYDSTVYGFRWVEVADIIRIHNTFFMIIIILTWVFKYAGKYLQT